MRRFVLLLLLLLLGLGAGGAFLLFVPKRVPETFVEFPSGTSSRTMAHLLQREKIIRSGFAFLLLRAIKGGRLQAGEYRFAGTANEVEVYARIQRGDVYTRTVVIPEGFNLFDIAHAVEASGLAPAANFLAAAHANADLVSTWAPQAETLEGFLFPDTYRFTRHASLRFMQETMVNRFRKAAAKMALSREVYRTVTLASLVEKEVRYDDERSLAAGVFTNRLERGMPLQTDPSVVYAAQLAQRWTGVIHRSDLQFESPYNTYLHPGLPPGPICSPGMAALEAATHPAITENLYFVADADGHTLFARSLKEHEVNVAAYRRSLGSSSQ